MNKFIIYIISFILGYLLCIIMGNGFSVGGADDPISFCDSENCTPCFSDPNPSPTLRLSSGPSRSSNRFKPTSHEVLLTAIHGALEFKPSGVNASYEGSYISDWDTSEITDMSYIFQDKAEFILDISGWDTSNVTNMSYMFNSAETFNIDISGWDVSNVLDMIQMFQNASDFDIDISGWDVSNVTNMSGMFIMAKSFNKDISSWDTSQVTDMSNLFYKASEFDQDISGWNTSQVTTMAGMFYKAEKFNGDIGGWDVRIVEDMSSMFRDASEFNQDLSNWDVKNVKAFSGMFEGATSLSDENIKNIKKWNVTCILNEPMYNPDLKNMFGDIQSSELTDFNNKDCKWFNFI